MECRCKEPNNSPPPPAEPRFQFISGFDNTYSPQTRAFVLQRYVRERKANQELSVKHARKPAPSRLRVVPKRSHAAHSADKDGAFCMNCTKFLAPDERKRQTRLCSNCQKEVSHQGNLKGSRTAVSSNALRDVREQRGWHFFREQTVSRIATSDREFWFRLIFQLGESHLAIHHLLISLGGMYESWDAGFKNLESSRRTDTPMRFGLQQCNKAISLLTAPDASSLSTGVVLASCLLFASFQNSQNHCETAFRHFESGLKILHQYNASRSSSNATASEDELIRKHLEPIFASHRTTATTNPACDITNPKHCYEHAWSRLGVFVFPEKFTNFPQARNLLFALIDLAFTTMETAFSQDSIQLPHSVLAHCQKLLHQWRTSFELFVSSINSPTTLEDLCISKRNMLLHIHHRVCCILLTTMPFDKEMLFDAHLQDFLDIVAISRQYVRQKGLVEFSAAEARMPCFSFNAGLMMPLFLVACRCRIPHVRREAVCILLEIQHQKEGFWESHTLAACAKRVIEVEERNYRMDDGTTTTMPDHHRIRLSAIMFDPGITTCSLSAGPVTPETSIASPTTTVSTFSSAILSPISPSLQLQPVEESPITFTAYLNQIPSFPPQTHPQYILYFTRPALSPSDPAFRGVEYEPAPAFSKPSVTISGEGAEVGAVRAPWKVTFSHQGGKCDWKKFFGKLEYFSFFDEAMREDVSRRGEVEDEYGFKRWNGEWIYMGESVQSSWWHHI